MRRWAPALLVVLTSLQFGTLAGTPAASAASAQPDVKPLLTGLLTRNGPPQAALESVVHSYVVRVAWKDLQQSAGGPLSTAALDQAFDDARASGARVKLRVMAGVDSPEWAKNLAGSPVPMTEPGGGASGTVPRFWTPEFGAAYADLQQRLAERYDAEPVLAEVVVSRCTLFYAEPFIRQTSLASNRAALLAAGYTRAADKSCHRQQIDAHRVWATTRSGLAFNPAQFVTAGGDRMVDDAFTVAMMRYCAERLGKRCVVENMSIRSPISSLDPNPKQPHYQRMYRSMAAGDASLAFQTAAPARLGNCTKTLGWAVRMGASYVELPQAAGTCSSNALASAAGQLGRPTAPRQVKAKRIESPGSVRLSWAAPRSGRSSPVKHYRILRKIDGHALKRVAELSASRRSWTDRPRRRSHVVFRVVAVNVAGPGPGSKSARVAR